MTSLKTLFRLLGISGFFVAVAAPGSAKETPVSPAMVAAWKDVQNFDFAGAERAFSALLAKNPNSRNALLGLAETLLDRPPTTNEKTARVEKLLRKVIAGDANDKIGIMASYQVARLYQVHFYPHDPAKASRLYLELYSKHPKNYMGQLALLRLSTIDLFSHWPVKDPSALVAKWQARKSDFTYPALRRNFLRKLGDAILWFNLPEKEALPLYIEANDIGFSRFDVRTLMLMKVFNLSVDEHMPDLTRKVAKRYLKEFPNDLWSQFMRDKLATLDAKGAK